MTNYIEEFIFTDRLKGELQALRTYPELLQLTPVLCFHGEPGVGKTSFAKLLCAELCADTQYFAMNERSLKNGFIEDQIKPLFRTRPIVNAGEGEISRGIILDEFHNLSPKDQDRFKVVLDDVKDCLVVICLNTIEEKQLSKCLTPPIYSRVHHINFNTAQGADAELDELVGKVKEKFPTLSATRVLGWLPDMRRIEREGRMSKLLSN